MSSLCQKLKGQQEGKSWSTEISCRAPLERIQIDILGSFVQSHRGNKYILVIVDQFTKWVECYSIPSQNAVEIARTLVEGFIVREGCPIQVHSDQGRQFESNLFQSLCDLLQISKTRTTPYHPSSNSQVERYNQTILAMIRCYLGGDQKNWDQNLQLIAGAIMSTRHRSTGFNPNMMLRGREISIHLDLMLGTPSENGQPRAPSEYVKHLRDILSKVHYQARENLQSAQLRQKKDNDCVIFEIVYEVGDVAYLLDSTTTFGQSSKLKSPWKGPYLVTKVLSPYLISILVTASKPFPAETTHQARRTT